MDEKLHDTSVDLPEDSDDDDADNDYMFSTANDSLADGARALRKLLQRSEISTYSTAFSGVDSPGTAYAQLREACSAAFARKSEPHAPEHLHAIDS